MPDLAVGHFRDFPSAPCRPLRLFGWQARCLLPSPPVPPFPCGRAASSRTIRAPELDNANSSSIPKDAPVIPSPSIPTHCPPDTPRASPHSAFYYFPCVIGFTANAAQCARTWICHQGNKVCICVICLQCGLADITAVFSCPLLQSPSHATPSFFRSSPPLPMPRVSEQ